MSEEFPFDDIVFSDSGLVFVQCYRRCVDAVHQSLACHVECLGLVPSESGRESFFDATWYRYPPTPAEHDRRTRWLLRTWSALVCATYPSLPVEICHQIARRCLRPFAVLRALVSCDKPSHRLAPAGCRLSLSGSVWVRHTLFEGARYVLSVANEQPRDQDDASDAVELVVGPGPVDTVFVAENHLGVRKLVFAARSEPPPAEQERPNIWWRAVAISRAASPSQQLEALNDVSADLFPEPQPPKMLSFLFSSFLSPTHPLDAPDSGKQGLKLRTLFSPTSKPAPEYCWAKPRIPTTPFWYTTLERAEDVLQIRMHPVDVNHPGITGYSVYQDSNLATIHAHYAGQDMSFYYQQLYTSKYGLWHYMPVDKGEIIIEIWRRESRVCGLDVSLVVRDIPKGPFSRHR